MVKQFLKLYYTYIVGAFVALALIGGVHWYIKDIKAKSYSQGFAKADGEWQKKANDFSARANQLYIQNSLLQGQLAELQDKQQKELQALKDRLTPLQEEYQKTPEAKESLGDGFIDLYNQSLGVN